VATPQNVRGSSSVTSRTCHRDILIFYLPVEGGVIATSLVSVGWSSRPRHTLSAVKGGIIAYEYYLISQISYPINIHKAKEIRLGRVIIDMTQFNIVKIDDQTI
jgi:hypothetical protein